jgi:hypothetical protein
MFANIRDPKRESYQMTIRSFNVLLCTHVQVLTADSADDIDRSNNTSIGKRGSFTDEVKYSERY